MVYFFYIVNLIYKSKNHNKKYSKKWTAIKLIMAKKIHIFF